jgi:hypothetical protein
MPQLYRWGLWAKHMGLKWGAIWEHPTLGNHWELEGNMFRTKEKWKKSSPPLTPPSKTQNLKEKKIKALWVHAEPSHWLHEISIFQNSSSPFLAWANTPIINWGYLFHLWISSTGLPPKFNLFFLLGAMSHFWLVHHPKKKKKQTEDFPK